MKKKSQKVNQCILKWIDEQIKIAEENYAKSFLMSAYSNRDLLLQIGAAIDTLKEVKNHIKSFEINLTKF